MAGQRAVREQAQTTAILGDATAVFDPRDVLTGRLLRGVGRCPDCMREDALSEFVVCKGSKRPENKGRLYQFVSFKSITYLSDLPDQTYEVPVQQRLQHTVALIRTTGKGGSRGVQGLLIISLARGPSHNAQLVDKRERKRSSKSKG